MKRRITKALALSALLAVGVTALAIAATGKSENTSTVNGKLNPKKLDKKKYKSAKLNAGVTTYANNDPNAHVNFPTKKVVLQFDDDAKVNVRVVRNCKVNLEQLTTDQARTACPKSILGDGFAHAVVVNDRVDDIVVTAFRTGNNILLHTDSETLGAGPTPDVKGKLSKAKGDYGTKATFNVPLLIGGQAALTKFQVRLKKGIKGRCHDKNKKFNVKGQFTYSDGSKDNAKSKAQCKRK